MEKVKINFIGKKDFVFSHGDVTETFKPGEVKEISADIAEKMIKEETIERKWKKDGSLESTTIIKLFEIATETIPSVIPAKAPVKRKVKKQTETVPAELPNPNDLIPNNTGENQ